MRDFSEKKYRQATFSVEGKQFSAVQKNFSLTKKIIIKEIRNQPKKYNSENHLLHHLIKTTVKKSTTIIVYLIRIHGKSSTNTHFVLHNCKTKSFNQSFLLEFTYTHTHTKQPTKCQKQWI